VVYFGSAEGKVYSMDAAVDNVLLTPPVTGPNGDEIAFSILTAFNAIETKGIYKSVKLIRPDFLSSAKPSFSILARYDYDLIEGLAAQFTDPSAVPNGIWDTDNWDNALWGSDERTAFLSIGGAWGVGRYVAVAMRGTCRAKTRLIGWDLIFTLGGPML